MNNDHLVRASGQTCTYAALSSQSETAALEKSEAFTTPATTLYCIADQPSSKWLAKWPGAKLANSIVLWLESTASVAPKGQVVFSNVTYRVLDVAVWPGTGVSMLCERAGGT